ncbi:YqcI/YcgG family protein [Nocardia sp. NPDC058658]|uniref:YqcI/YcgG family protein n=1 Tax=Nocardia sp. NPDC058658 TaxID=3346580 RepID=UPI00365F184C
MTRWLRVERIGGHQLGVEIWFGRNAGLTTDARAELQNFLFGPGGCSSDPQCGEFRYSVAGHPFFVIGLHETHRRFGRRPPFPMLAFMLQGDTNRNLMEYVTLSEARRYSGRPKPVDWQCPSPHVPRRRNVRWRSRSTPDAVRCDPVGVVASADLYR